MTKPPTDFFSEDLARRYDERNSKLAPIADSLHFLMRLVLEDLPARARILSVGAGTGADILSLAQEFPEWTFVAVEPSLSMLDVCRERTHSAGVADRCEFVHGLVDDVPATPEFDAAVALLVAHFVRHDARPDFFEDIAARLRVGGILINAEISFDLESKQFPSMLRNWQTVQRLMGGTPESLQALPKQLREVLTVLPPDETESLLRASGIESPLRFFQAFMITAWHGVKT